MKNNEKERKQIFFAYQGPAENSYNNNVAAIRRGCEDYNKYQTKYYAKAWETMKSNGKFIDKEILKEIENSEIFACDLSFLNHNVVFELGYAIAKGKILKIFLNKDITGSRERYNDFIFPTLGYTHFSNSKDITAALNNHTDDDANTHLKEEIQKSTANINSDIFYIPNVNNTQASIELDAYMQSLSDLKVVIEDKTEIGYQSLKYYISRISSAQTLIIHMSANMEIGANEDNCKKSFWAGVSCGLGRHTVLLAPAKFKAPLDYYDITIEYSSPEECTKSIEAWITDNLRTTKSMTIASTNRKEESSFDMIKVALECIAENEKETLSSYFVETGPYKAALNNAGKIILKGRKGSGKTAIYLKLLEVFKENDHNFVINLKPDSEELINNIDISQMYSTKITFFLSVWRTVIYSKLITEIHARIKQKEIDGILLSKEEEDIISFVQRNAEYMNKNFYGIINTMSNYPTDKPKMLEYLYSNYLNPLIDILVSYFKDKKYYKLIIMADNLDKTWNEQMDLSIQGEMILSILDVDNKIKKELKNEKLSILSFVFLREDIYDFIFKTANEPDKMRTFTYSIDWSLYAMRLKEVVEKRFEHVLNKKAMNIWSEYFDIKGKKDVFVEITKRIILRPRDILYFISKMLESASDRLHTKADKIDLEYASKEYTSFLNWNLIAEMKAEFPEIKVILPLLQQHNNNKYSKIRKIISQNLVDNTKVDDLITSLFDHKYLKAIDKNKHVYITHHELKAYIKTRNKTGFWGRIFGFMKADNVNLYINSTYY